MIFSCQFVRHDRCTGIQAAHGIVCAGTFRSKRSHAVIDWKKVVVLLSHLLGSPEGIYEMIRDFL
jgi:hypothetical protein